MKTLVLILGGDNQLELLQNKLCFLSNEIVINICGLKSGFMKIWAQGLKLITLDRVLIGGIPCENKWDTLRTISLIIPPSGLHPPCPLPSLPTSTFPSKIGESVRNTCNAVPDIGDIHPAHSGTDHPEVNSKIFFYHLGRYDGAVETLLSHLAEKQQGSLFDTTKRERKQVV